MSRIGKSMETESRLVVTSSWKEGGKGRLMGTKFLLGVIKMF